MRREYDLYVLCGKCGIPKTKLDCETEFTKSKRSTCQIYRSCGCKINPDTGKQYCNCSQLDNTSFCKCTDNLCTTPPKSSGYSTPTKTCGCSTSPKPSECKTSSKPCGCSTPAKPCGCNTPPKTCGCNTSPKSCGCNTPSKSCGCNTPTKPSGCNNPVQTGGWKPVENTSYKKPENTPEKNQYYNTQPAQVVVSRNNIQGVNPVDIQVNESEYEIRADIVV